MWDCYYFVTIRLRLAIPTDNETLKKIVAPVLL